MSVWPAGADRPLGEDTGYGRWVGDSRGAAMDVDEALALEQASTWPAGCEADEALTVLAAEVRRLHTWNGLMSLLDEHYPADVPLGPDSDPGPRILALVRALDERDRQIIEQAERMRALGEDWGRRD